MGNPIDKKEILNAAQKWFREVIATNHVKNTKKLKKIRQFKINPFLVLYLSNFLTGDNDPKSIAKALVYPRVLGSSITTSFGQNLQKLTTELFRSLGSTTPGIDIEFTDQLDGRKKYCQLKAGPSTLNKDDIQTIHQHFKDIKNIARTNSLAIQQGDLIVGVLYGDRTELSDHYRKLESKYYYPVYVGQDFWHRLTGDDKFYFEIIEAVSSVANEFDGRENLEKAINELSKSELIVKLSQQIKAARLSE